jgi:hypothetical protein
MHGDSMGKWEGYPSLGIWSCILGREECRHRDAAVPGILSRVPET